MSRRSKKKVPPRKDAAASSSAPVPGPGRDAFSGIGTHWVVFGVCLLLAVITAAVFGRTFGYDFIPYDDNAYVYDNPDVIRGLSLKSIRWAFTHSELGLWTPLTTISHMLDCQIYGLNPGGHHLTNVLLHIATVIALFLVLRQMTGALWRSAFVAAVFAIHPLRAESVAWVAERKDVLSGLFFMLTIGAYLHYVRRQSVARYLPVALLFALGIMAKQMIVTLPCVLLLLDYWPLGRFERKPGEGRGGAAVFLRLVLEKVPLFALTILSCIKSFWDRRPDTVAVVPEAHTISWLRIDNALVSCVVYMEKMFYPANLAVFYPYPSSVPAWQALGAFALLAGISIAVFAWRKRHPAFLVGWFWYVGMLVPVIGFISLGKEGHADRYTYLSQIGLCIMVAWGAASLSALWRYRGEISSIAAAPVLATLARFAVIQTANWRDGITLWQHALACTPDNAFARNYLGYALFKEDRDDEAIVEFEKAIELMPDYAEPENNLGIILLQKGEVDDAIIHFEKALQIDPGHVEARSNLALALIQKGLLDDAVTELQMVLRIKPNRADAYSDIGNVLLQKGDVEGAIAQFKKALEIKPDYADGHANLGNALLQKGKPHEAIAQYLDALDITPQDVTVQINMARVLATCTDASVRDGNKAVVLASQADELSGGKDPAVLDTLAAAYAEAGRFSEAIETSQRALELANASGNTKLANNLQAHLVLYRANSPLRLPFKRIPGR